MTPGEGFEFLTIAGATIKLSGSYTHNASVSGPSYSNTKAGMYILAGNPYPSTLDWDNTSGWTKTNINPTLYMYSAASKTITTYLSGSGTNGGTNLIPVEQAFMFTTTGTGGSTSQLIMNSLCRVTTSTSYMRTLNSQKLMLEILTPGGQIDQTLLNFNELSSSDYDGSVDALKIMNPSTVPSLYTVVSSSGTDLAINTRPMLTAGEVIPLNLKTISNGTYTIRCSQNEIEGYQLLLVDKFKNTQMLVDTTLRYAVVSTTEDSLDRFELKLAPVILHGQQPGNPGSSNNSVSIYTSPGGFLVQADQTNAGISTIYIMDAAGRQLQTQSNVNLQAGNNFYSLLDYSSGVYLIRVTTVNGSYVQQVSYIK